MKMMIMMMMVVILSLSFFSQKKQTLQKRETVKEFLIVRAKKVDPFFFLCLCSRDSTCEKRGEKVPLSLHFKE